MTPVLSGNNTGSDAELIVRGRSFIYIINTRDPTTDPWGTPCFNILQSQNNFWVILGDFTSTFCLLLVK
jgi:hypothetical protein